MVSVPLSPTAPPDVPPHLYQHPDPLLRRLRLESPSGVPITDIRAYFQDKKVIVFYFGGVWGVGAGLAKGLHLDLTKLVLAEPKNFCLIYVSTDSKESDMKSVLQGLPWCRMTFHDNSDFAPIAKHAPPEVTELLRGEDFVSASELEDYDMPSEGYPDELQYEYARPFSRAALTAYIGALKTPTLTVYHLPTHKILDRFANPSHFRPGQASRKFSLWKAGRTEGVQARDVWEAMRWPLIMAVLAALFHLYCWWFGPESNPLLHLQRYFVESRFPSPPSPILVASASSPPISSSLSSPSSTTASSIASHARATLGNAAARHLGDFGNLKTRPTVKAEPI